MEKSQLRAAIPISGIAALFYINIYKIFDYIYFQKPNINTQLKACSGAWLFADTLKGARAKGVLSTMVETAKANELDVYEYLNHLLEEMPNNDYLKYPEVLDKYLP